MSSVFFFSACQHGGISAKDVSFLQEKIIVRFVSSCVVLKSNLSFLIILYSSFIFLSVLFLKKQGRKRLIKSHTTIYCDVKLIKSLNLGFKKCSVNF